MIVGVEIGGTYTDVVLVEEDGRLHCHKVGTTPDDPSEGAIRGVHEILQRAGRAAADLQELVHGSTIATNTLLQRKGARTALITAGFADVVFLGRTNKDAMYELFYRKPEPLVRRRQVIEVQERVSGSGEVILPPDTTDLLARLDALVAADGIEAVAVCLLNAHANPAHEQQLGALLRRQRPGLAVTLSSEITPEHREYERSSTATLNAYVQPVVSRYLERFARRSQALGVREPPLIMVSSGGVVPIAAASRMAARMFLSGPAAAVTGGSFVGARCGVPDLISVDVGGTSTDVCLIENGRPRTTVQGTSEAQIAGLPLNVVMTDVCSIGSGGGSIAQIDAQGRLGVGPQSAGARPGPACYGRGGQQFTLTDALLILGYLDPDAELADGLRLSLPRALAAAAPLAAQLQVDEAGVAQRVLRVAVADMARAVRRVSVRRGRDPRDYALLACGGCGPLLAAALADEVGIRQVLVPAHAGIFSAFGLAVSDLRLDAAVADPGGPLALRTAATLADQLQTLRAGSMAEFAALGVAEAGLETRYMLDLRYRGQGYELRIDVAAGETPAALVQRFHEQHERQYGYRMHNAVEAVMQRCTLTRRRSPPVMQTPPSPSAPPERPRAVCVGAGRQAWPVCARSQLGTDSVPGPLVVMEDSTSTLVPADWQVQADRSGVLHLTPGCAMSRIDAADYSVLSQTLQAVAAEMGDILQLSAHSSVVRETRDCATVLSDRDGHAVAQAEMNAIHVNSVQSVFDWARERLDFDSLRPGEALITNHPYQNGQHLNDIFVLLPVFHDGRRIGFASSVCHHIDIGGAIAGANAAATDYQQEGFVIPLMRVDLQRDLLGGSVEQLLAANIRMPGVVIGDFRAQISAVLRGQLLLERLAARHGIALLGDCMQDMLDASEAQMRAVLQAMPDGTHDAVDLMDGPRVGAPTIPIRVQLRIDGDTACVDLRDNDDAVRWPVNATRASTHAAVMTMFACQLPTGTPINAGLFRPIRILTRPGSILDPLPPSPVRGRMAPVSRVASALKRALAAAGAPRISAGGGDATNFITWTWQAPDGSYRMYAEGVAGGYGAGDTCDGESGLCQTLVNVLNTPVEAIERDHDFVRILEYTLIPDSGGAGRQRGGLAVRRRYEVLRDGVKLSTTGDRHGSRPWGLHGGQPGTSASYTIVRGGVQRQIPAAATEDLQRGDLFIAEAPGGGGWGDPRERSRDSVAQDLADGRISASAAREVYGMTEHEIAATIPATPHRSQPR